MCFLGQNYALASKCKERGGISRLLVMKGETFTAATWTEGTLLTRGQFTAVTGIPATSVIEIAIDKGQSNTAEIVKEPTSAVYTNTITVTRRGLDINNFLVGYDITDCCGLVVVVQEGDSNYMIYGVDSGTEVVGFEVGHNKNLGENATTTPTNTYTFSFAEGTGTIKEGWRIPKTVFDTIVAAKVA